VFEGVKFEYVDVGDTTLAYGTAPTGLGSAMTHWNATSPPGSCIETTPDSRLNLRAAD